MTPLDQERLLDLVVEWDRQRRQGTMTSPEELCPDDPAMQSALRDRIAQRLQIVRMLEPATSVLGASCSRIFSSKESPVADVREGLSPEVPELIGRYRVERLLGSGGFGLVFLAYDDELKRNVAIKVPHAELVKRPEQAEAYKREARSVASLDHPHIVPVYDVGSTQRYPCFVVSKYISGINLSARMKQSRLPFLESAELIATVADALHYAHTHGLVHRDVKPMNILISASGKPFLVDFGLALREQDTGAGRRFAGTPAYMSPEQARGEAHRVDGRSDIFSLGVVLYELLVGRKPFQGASSGELLTEIVSAEPKPPRQIDDRMPKEVERICLKALAKRASDRYTTACDLADDLRQLIVNSYMPTTESSLRAPGSSAANTTIEMAAGSERSSNLSLSDRNQKAVAVADGDIMPKIVPRGLRSFDEQDAEFFLQLLPGPRDRDGLPDSIRFWKTRIEERDINKTFTIGMVYGPSGCGKSSLIKAGLLPRLSENVISIYLEATAATTESRLLNGVRRRFPGLSNDFGLMETLTALRHGRGTASGGKVLIVLDQFEQWLHGRQSLAEQSSSELIEALRQCDGEHLQALVMVRDDFWMAATGFARDLEIPLVDGHSANAVNLFPVRHARQVLIEFGRAFGCITDLSERMDSDQALFVDRAIGELAEGGRVVPVRLVIFVEMMKDKPWNLATLTHVGGIKGVGVTFLDAMFSGINAPASQRYHQRAAQAVLKALLPEAGTDIKGHVRTYFELLNVSGYSNRRSDFEDLIRILNRELRLVTLTDPFGVTDGNASVPKSGSDQQCFQLTHDYLVPSLRDWLTRKQKETRRGRAELQLADRAALWHIRPDKRLLPTLIEFISLRLLTDSKNWTIVQRQMMIVAGRRHAVRMSGLVTLVLMIAIGIQGQYSSRIREQVKTGVDMVLNSGSVVAPNAMKDLRTLPRDLVERELRARVATSDDARKLRLAYAQSELGNVDFKFLISQIENSSADEADHLIVALGHSRKKALDAVRAQAKRSEQVGNRLLKARFALIALYLGESDIAVEMCQIEDRPDPIQRTCFIESFCGWHGDVVKLVEFARHTEDVGLRSALCLGLAGMSTDRVTNAARVAWNPLFTNWFQTAPDGVTHSAAGLPLLYWGLEVFLVDSMTRADDARDWYINSVGMTLIAIPPRQSMRRFKSTDSRNDPPSFLMSDRETTMAQIGLFLTDPECAAAEKPVEIPPFIRINPPLPAHQVRWDDAVLFCNWLSRKGGFTPCYERTGTKGRLNEDQWRLLEPADGYRLPSESQWEYACRAGTTTPFSFGDTLFLARYANHAGPNLDPCAIRFPNGWGIFDMHGNVAEWCNDSHPDPSNDMRRIRGGDWTFRPEGASSSSAGEHFPYSRFERVGFRVIRVPSTDPSRSAPREPPLVQPRAH